MSAELIDRFYKDGKHNPLSNFYESPFLFNPTQILGVEPVFDFGGLITAPTVEHGYQAMKSTNDEDFLWIMECSTPGQAKRAGQPKRLKNIRPDWEAVKIPVMRHLLRRKFQDNRDLAHYLWLTGDAYLIEGNDWNDQFWGCVKSEHGGYTQGQNWLGVLLMAERALWQFRYVNQFPLL